MRKQIKSYFSAVLFSGVLTFAGTAHGSEIVLGGHSGALGTSGTGVNSDESTLGYGVNLKINPYDWAALKLDATMARWNGKAYFSSSPAVMLTPFLYEEFAVGLLAGPGFYKLPNQSTKFGINLGVAGDFNLGSNLSVGMDARYHTLFDSVDVWTVFANLGFRFQLGDDW